MVEEVICEGEVLGLIPAGCVVRGFCAKNIATYNLGGTGGWLAGGVLPGLNIFPNFKIGFLKNSLPSAF